MLGSQVEGTKPYWEQYPVSVWIFKYVKMQTDLRGDFQNTFNREKTEMAAEITTAALSDLCVCEEQQFAVCKSLFQHPNALGANLTLQMCHRGGKQYEGLMSGACIHKYLLYFLLKSYHLLKRRK